MTQLDSNKVVECEAISEPPVEIRFRIEQIARLIGLRGLEIEKRMLTVNMIGSNSSSENLSAIENFSFLKSSDPYHAFYRKRLDRYIAYYNDGILKISAPDAFDLEPPPDRNRDHPPFSFPAGITLKELGIIKLTAQFVARYGRKFWEVLIVEVFLNPLFSFMKVTHSKYSFYKGLVVAYQRVLWPHNVYSADTILEGFFHCLQLEKLDEKLIDLHAFVGGLDCFTLMDDADLSTTMPPPEPLSIMMMRPEMPPLRSQLTEYHAQNDIQPDNSAKPTFPARITLKELGIIKLTAQFVARYGKYFLQALMMRVVMNPQFEFLFFSQYLRPWFLLMEPVEIKFHIYSELLDAYSKILMPSKYLEQNDASPATVLEVFFLRLQLEKLEEGMETAMIDLHAFVAGVDYFAHMDDAHYSAIMAPPERLSVMMSRPTHMHPGMLVLFPVGRQLSLYTYHHPRARRSPLADTFPPRITLEEVGIIKLTAQFLARYEDPFKLALMSRVYMEPRFDFLKRTNSRRDVDRFLEVYFGVLKSSKKLKKSNDCVAIALEFFFHCLQLEKLKTGVETSVIELHAFMSGVDYFAYRDDADYSAIMPHPQRLSVMMNWRSPHHVQNQDGAHQDDIQVPDAPPATHECVGDAQTDLEPPLLRKPTLRPRSSFPSHGVTQKELVIIKLTALFVVRYGMLFGRDLMKKMGMKPQFKFMEPTDTRFGFYNMVVDAYSKVLKASYDAYTGTVLESYLHWLQWEELEEVVPMAMVDLHAFVEGVDCFAQMEDDNYSDIMGNQVTQMQYASPSTGMMQTMPGISSRQPLPLSEEPEPKRQKVDESARVPDDQFLATGSPRIRVSVPTLDGRQVIEMTVKSLSENVASLKEKIAQVVEMPANELKLSGKAGFLEDNKSLAHYSVGAGEIIRLSWRISRWT